jgi:4-alpha-glucanotransferase
LFWNELFVDVTRLPELSDCIEAQELVGSEPFQSELRALRAGRFVDYASAMQLKRSALLLLSRHLSRMHGRRFDAMQTYVDRTANLTEYARFRATTAMRRQVWTTWQSPTSDHESNRDEEFYHTYCQFVANEQIEGLTKRCDVEGASLYLDYPLGVHAEGFDTWKYQTLFARQAAVGAPPYTVFTTGQDWGFHPVLPEVQRREGSRYLIESLRHQMRHAGMLRIDHVMGLHRMYWIPKGFDKSDGAYVHYPSEEIYAILSLESNRSSTVLVGENLGLVPGYVEQAMGRHGLAGMNVAYWEIAADPDGALQRLAARPKAVASLNTHDMFPFAAFWHALDADKRQELGMINAEQADLERWVRGELRNRLTGYLREHGYDISNEDDVAGALRGMLALLAKSEARWLLITLEDLWLETSPQNIPDTVTEHPNWRQKARLTLEELIRDVHIESLLKMVDAARRPPAS